MPGRPDAAPGLSALHVAAIRRLRFIWVPVEAGAPAVDPWQPFGSPDALDDLGTVTGTRDEAAVRRLYCEAMNLLPGFVAAAAPRLAPGRYVLEGADAERLRDFMPGGDPGIAEDGGFEYTAGHAAALPHLHWEFLDAAGEASRKPLTPEGIVPNPAGDEEDGGPAWPVAAVSVNRPYGDAADPEPPTLHHTVAAALRVLVLHGQA